MSDLRFAPPTDGPFAGADRFEPRAAPIETTSASVR